MSPLLVIYIFWLIITAVGILYIVPTYVPSKYKDVTAHFLTMGFALISLISKFVYKYYYGTLTYMFLVLFVFSLAIFATLVSGAYYWMPKYSNSPDDTTSVNMFVGFFTTSLIFINLYDQEYQDTIYKTGDLIGMAAGKRKR